MGESLEGESLEGESLEGESREGEGREGEDEHRNETAPQISTAAEEGEEIEPQDLEAGVRARGRR